MTDRTETSAVPQDATQDGTQDGTPEGTAEESTAEKSTAPPAAETAEPAEGTDPADEGTEEASDSEADSEAGTPDGGSRRKPSVQRLEEEGDVAADYLEELLDILDLDGDIDIDVENGRAAVSVVADPGSERALKRLVGKDGEVLEALQELTRLAVQTSTGERTRLMLDVAGHRADRRTELEKVATAAAEQVRSGGEKVSLSPMTPFERKVVHDTVAAAGLRSESEGEDAGRHVVVLPA